MSPRSHREGKRDPPGAGQGRSEERQEARRHHREDRHWRHRQVLQGDLPAAAAVRYDDKVSVEEHIAAVAKQVGASIKLVNYTRFEKGEGIEKRQDDLAEEVAKLIK